MANPLRAAWDYLRGADLQPPRTALPAPAAATKTQPVVEQKLYYNTDVGAAIRLGTLVHGPGASELLGMAYGAGQDGNSAVFATLMAICNAYPAAPLRVYRRTTKGSPEIVDNHPLEQLLRRPNPHMTGKELVWWMQWALHVYGNAYWRKVRAGNPLTGNVVELWPVSPATLEPRTTREDRARGMFISHYRHEYETGKYENLPVENVVHFKFGVDDYDHRLGTSPLKRLLREVMTDDEATKFTDNLLHNYAVPGLVAQTQADLDEATADAIKQKLSSKFGNGNQGNVAVLDNGMTMQQFGFSPQQMDMKALHNIPETRIAAVFGVPAIVVGLAAGLERSTFSNVREAREMLFEQKILPSYEFDAARLDLQLLPDFATDPALFCAYDILDVRALQEDENQRWTRLTASLEKGGITRNTYLNELGYDPETDEDVIYVPSSVTPTKPEDLAAPPEPAPAPDQQATDGQATGTTGRGRLRLVGNGSKASAIQPQLTPRDFPELFDALRALAEPALTDELDAYLDNQRQRIKARLLADATDSGTADPDTARAALPRAAGA